MNVETNMKMKIFNKIKNGLIIFFLHYMYKQIWSYLLLLLLMVAPTNAATIAATRKSATIVATRTSRKTAATRTSRKTVATRTSRNVAAIAAATKSSYHINRSLLNYL